jgi:hypothetical protein
MLVVRVASLALALVDATIRTAVDRLWTDLGFGPDLGDKWYCVSSPSTGY